MEKLVNQKHQQQHQQTGLLFRPPNMRRPPTIPSGTIPPIPSIPTIDVNTSTIPSIPTIDVNTGTISPVPQKIRVIKRKPRPDTTRSNFAPPRTNNEAFWKEVKDSNKFAQEMKNQNTNNNNINQ